ncbi:hypothetical protein MTsPCn9_18070 [Croceitalea sp. MTPC9]|uniref:hypothetical protein n=1 Tax=unclassified Croceitalea TaxID=2632280 RepID=UPI002B3C3130|nr:hypothetical protein MTsPCn6_10920 [Croceitalea sp. MTPC6]GMN16871.1 hypothetical protein MTsPCn9_18070 [Croceitalea sp. MTPC9]
MDKKLIGQILIGLALLIMILKWTILKDSEYRTMIWVIQFAFAFGGLYLIRNREKDNKK